MENGNVGGPSLARIGGGAGFIGAALAIAGNLLHVRLPGDAAVALMLIAEEPYWDLIHLTIILAAVSLSVFFIALGSVLDTGPGRGWGWSAVTVGLLGAVVLIVGIGVDGFAGKAAADLYYQSTAEARTQHFHIANAVNQLQTGLLYVWLMLVFGLQYVGIGLAGLADGRWSRWLGWVAVVLGAFTAVLSAVGYIAPSLVSTHVYGLLALALTLWVFFIAKWLWRQDV